MSQENVELAHRVVDAFNRRDLDAFLAIADPDVEIYSRVLELEGGGPYRGHDGVRSWSENVAPALRSEIEEVRDAGDTTITRIRLRLDVERRLDHLDRRGHGVGSDALLEETHWIVTRWRNGKAIWMRIVGSEAEALEAAGLSE